MNVLEISLPAVDVETAQPDTEFLAPALLEMIAGGTGLVNNI